jgi:hypothetical protein
MNDDGLLVGALVQWNEVILHDVHETPRPHGRGDPSLRLNPLLATLRERAQQLPPASRRVQHLRLGRNRLCATPTARSGSEQK